MVTICTASLTFNNSTFCPHTVLMCFVWISEQTAIISLYNINWLVFITEKECVYCAVRTGYLNAIQYIIAVTAQTVTLRSLIAYFSRSVQLRFAMNKVALGQVFLQMLLFPLTILLQQWSVLTLCQHFNRTKKRKKLESLQTKKSFFCYRLKIGEKSVFTLFISFYHLCFPGL